MEGGGQGKKAENIDGLRVGGTELERRNCPGAGLSLG